jgi:hypothetical protein
MQVSQGTDSRTNNAATTVDFVDERGAPIKLLVRRFTDEDFSTLDEWVRGQHVRTARASLGPTSTPEERDEILGLAMHQAASMTWMHGLGAHMIASMDGIAMLVWVATRRDHPDLSYERIRTLIFNPENIKENIRRWNDKMEELKRQGKSSSATERGLSGPDKRADRRRRAKTSTAASRESTGGRSR